MGYSGDSQVLIRIAIFGMVISIISTAMITVMLADMSDSDYDFDEIQAYRDEVSSFTGQSMLSSTPWVLTHVYTPWISSEGIDGHLDDDYWLYGEEIDDYSYLGKVASIKLDPDQKSSVPITVSDSEYSYEVEDGLKWWAEDWWSSITRPIGEFFGANPYNMTDVTVTVWNYTGYRYVFNSTLPLAVKTDTTTSVKDGALSLVWYSYQAANGLQEGLSGGLDVYGGDVLLASYSATDIIEGYNSASGYATSYDFDFEGTSLTLSIQFDSTAIESGTTLMEAWTTGQWSMAITSLSVGNFLDINNSNSYSATGASMIKTFIRIYTLDLPNIENDWMNIILWLLVGLPFTLSLALITLRAMEAVKII